MTAENNNVTTNYWRQLGIFCSIDIFVNVILQFVAQDVEPETPGMLIVNLFSFIMFPTLIGIMVKTTRLNNRFTVLKKFTLILGLLMVNFVTIFFINYLNLFNRNIDNQDIIEGIALTSKFHLYVLCPVVIVIGLFLKTKQTSITENII